MATYTPEQLAKRNQSKWTIVQAVLAPLQLLAFLISFALVVHYLITGRGLLAADISVLVKISLLWLITVTGMIWEKEIFGHWFLAPQFYWEDVGNAVAMVLHNLYFVARWLGWSDRAVMTLMLLAYLSYLVNLAQFVAKGLQARKQRQQASSVLPAAAVELE
ncbi:MAG: 2-vinyl bacteriochlorophyllide hydratase [Anaerolineales bacterium]|nr:2-vinyl bacteriochlorophyllide hydratase [Anaerolineales bacterium]MCB0010484.1 2-vinyl bacteriochlorophyllide hydratase [Anaerolineales bacterium]MCB0017644.1 2-vinyl bacteriochlorophyllide hydratase [Anaerolineales bacterium]MCB0031680.1 2-vinyl bacteriochlorophyllide hydratase [Anaerolineales bacterium]MCB8960985.1 2-vinyl bacteriochlorophyllide hydratase [Ardenticatenales bacterium]